MCVSVFTSLPIEAAELYFKMPGRDHPNFLVPCRLSTAAVTPAQLLIRGTDLYTPGKVSATPSLKRKEHVTEQADDGDRAKARLGHARLELIPLECFCLLGVCFGSEVLSLGFPPGQR
jgi:hypothetical protein